MAFPKVKFVSTTYIKENTVIEPNFDDNKLVPFIYSTQRVVLEQSLGTTFYRHLEDAVVNNTLNSDEENLLRDYIQPMLANYVFYEVFPFINYKATNKAISKESSEYSQSSDLEEVKYVRNSIFNMAQFYLKRLNKFLTDYPNMFPQYANQGSKPNLPKNSKSYFSGVYVPRNMNVRMRIPIFDDPSEPGGYYDCDDCY
jgi:hypothetical protein